MVIHKFILRNHSHYQEKCSLQRGWSVLGNVVSTDIHLAGLIRRGGNASKSDQCILRMKAADIPNICQELKKCLRYENPDCLNLRHSAYTTFSVLVYVLGFWNAEITTTLFAPLLVFRQKNIKLLLYSKRERLKMKSLLVGNGINIQFGGKAYSNYFIMERIKFRAKLDSYLKLFGNTLTSSQIINILNGFIDIANDIRSGKYDKFVKEQDDMDALDDFKNRYTKTLTKSYEIMLEDWFLLIHMFFLKNNDLVNNKAAAIQGFEQLILDGIYNGGKIQELYLKMSKNVKRFYNSYDNIFSLNYDNNIEMLTNKEVFHLHGDFKVLANSENPDNVLGYIRSQEGKVAIVKGMEHCFCNALLNYSGKLKYKTADDFHQLIVLSNIFGLQYQDDPIFRKQLSDLREKDPLQYQMIMTKRQHPELNIATEYYFDKFGSIVDELHIVGMSPNNDDHIFNLITKNKSLSKVLFYYFSETEKNYIEEHFSGDLFCCENVQNLWKSLGCIYPKYNCKYPIPLKIDQYINCFNEMSGCVSTKEEILKEISETPLFEMKRLCKLVKKDMQQRNPEQKATNMTEFWKSMASISYIALQEGILPSTLYMICIMNFNLVKD